MAALTFTSTFDAAFFDGTSGVSTLVPYPYDVALNGRPYMLQLDPNSIEKWGQHFGRESLPLVRDQSDQSDEPGEQSVSPEQFWRRSQQSWHKGAGQSWLDWANTSDRNRFRSSKGLNPWTQKQLTLHNATGSAKVSANTSLCMCMAGSRCYFGSGTGQSTFYSTDGTTWTAVTGTPAATVSSVTSDGFSVYLAYNASGIYKTDTSSGAAASWATGTVSLVGYVKGRLMAANGPSIYNVVAGGALPAALFTHANSNFAWVGFTEGPGFIYAAGFSGGHSEIYSVTLTDTASTLGAPKIAAELPEGEIVRSVRGYQGFMVIGTDKGVRLATINNDGSLILGGLINTGTSVRCLDAQDRFVWFGWTNYDGTSTGLGRVDLSVFTSTLVPAYASDLMATSQGVVSATVLLGSTRLFTVEGVGVYKETPGTVVASGTMDTGFIGYDLADEKQAVFFDLRHEPMPTGGSVNVALAADNGTFAPQGTSSAVSTTAPAAFYLNGQQGERFEIRLTLNASSSAPILTRWTLRADVTPQPSSMFVVPLVITDRHNVHDSDYPADPYADKAALVALHDNQIIFAYQEGVDTYQVKLANYAWLPQQRSADTPGVYDGTFVAQLRHISG